MKKVKILFCLLTLLIFSQGTVFGKSNQQNSENNIEENLTYSSAIENVRASSLTKGFQVSWHINYDKIQELERENYSISIRYHIKSEAERLEKGYSDSEWTQLSDIDLKTISYEVENLVGGEEYVFQIGLSEGEQEYWTSVTSVDTKREWGTFDFFILMGSLALFLYGMKVMSDGLQQATGKKLRNILGTMTSNSFKGILTGLGISTLIQSSSVTTVMTVSFVNAGILTLFQAAGVIMGANIGTTVTAWLIDVFGFKVDISPYTLIMLAIGMPMLFFSSQKIKNWASVIVGFALLFLGLGFLKDSVPEVSPDSAIVNFFLEVNSIPYVSTIICVLFGTVLTLIIQSSSATIALTMTLMASGVIPFEVAAAMVLGENIGTTITAELAATVGNVHAKRAGRIHSTFNIFGVIWVLLIFPFFIQAVVYVTEWMSGGNPLTQPEEYGSTGLALLHTIFNLTNTLLMVGFIPLLVKFVERTVKSRGGSDEQFQLEYIGTGKGQKTPELSLLEVKKELARFGEITSRMSSFTQQLLMEQNRKGRQDLLKRIEKYEGITDEVEVEITNYLNKMSSKSVDEDLAIRINGMNRISSNLERIGDVFFQISKMIEKKYTEKIVFSETQIARMMEMFALIDEAFSIMNENLKGHSEDVSLVDAQKIEQKINAKRDEIRREYYNKMLTQINDSGIEGELIYNNIYNSLERIGDHIINVSEGISGKI